MPTGVTNRAEPKRLSKLRYQELTERCFYRSALRAPFDNLVGAGQASTLQIVFSLEPCGDLLNHLTTIGIVS
jgi:hypothetical protein